MTFFPIVVNAYDKIMQGNFYIGIVQMYVLNLFQPLRTPVLLVVFSVWFFAVPILAQTTSFENPPIDYHNAEVSDPVAQLVAKIKSGEVELKFDSKYGYLPAVLSALEIPTSSQTLVFSKTSLQLSRINPSRPRAVYFNDDVYVGFCQRGDVLELASNDDQQGAIFYTLKQKQDGDPTFVRDRGQCLTCHANTRTQNVPGYLIRSVYADRAGHPILGSGTYTTDHTSPFNERWGGWYVTGTHGEMRHMGNAIFSEDERANLEEGANVKDLSELVSTKAYLTPHSDIVALMVMEHQTQMHNAITAANFETRQALHQSYQMNELLERDAGHISDSARRRISAVADNVVAHLLMCDEFPLTAAVAGTSGYTDEFAARGIRDSAGRSLRDFDLRTRVFKYPCSYLIYSTAFDSLPADVHKLIVERTLDVLEGRNDSPEFKHLTAELKTAILEILHDTKPEFFKES